MRLGTHTGAYMSAIINYHITIYTTYPMTTYFNDIAITYAPQRCVLPNGIAICVMCAPGNQVQIQAEDRGLSHIVDMVGSHIAVRDRLYMVACMWGVW